ncbi:hypothetical protein [Bradyrhizobium retamae]|uniref:hypothetical protein n=1 Tax=Bradyrhizobium retamae TaxID=1300035 RepID=UPI0012E38E9A|nr:hypothetical protein [Bradyrhizobium retamae]
MTYLWPSAREFGYGLLGVGTFALAVAASGALLSIWDRLKSKVGAARTMLLFGILGTWVFLTFSVVLFVWAIFHPRPMPLQASAPARDDGPLQWYYNIVMNGGPLAGSNVGSLTFPGGNISQKEVSLKSAAIRSAIDGSELTLKVDTQNELVAIDQINLIPPGAPIRLVAVFPKQGGLSKEEFLASWSRFNLVVKDDTKEYRVPFNEGSIAPFFPGMVGPRVTKKQ